MNTESSIAAAERDQRLSGWQRLGGLAGLVATPLRPSHYLGLMNPLWATHVLQARVVDVVDETDDARTLTLRPGRGWRPHRAGQFVSLGVSIDGIRHTRTYSISSSPQRRDGCITVTVKALAGGRVSPFLVRRLRRGSYVSIGQPQGDFMLPEGRPLRPLFLTAGSGITPVMSMLRTFHLRGTMPDVRHIHYAPHRRDVIFASELAELDATEANYRPHLIYTREAAAVATARHFDAAQLESLCPDWRQREVWACGPASMLDAIQALWMTNGLEGRLHIERFQAPRTASSGAAAGGTVAFATSRRSVEADGRTALLEVAEKAGLRPAHGCRMGICHSCDAVLRKGCVRDLRSGTLIESAGQKVQICVCAPAGDVELEL